MRLYSGMSSEFIQDSARNQIADRLGSAFFAYYRCRPSPGELNSWRNSLRAMAQMLEYAQLKDQGVMLEYQLPLTSKRLDCLVCGRDESKTDQAVIVELKQWEQCQASDADKLVRSWLGGREREVLHPSIQVDQYRQYLEDTHSAFFEGSAPVGLSSCSYLHNYIPVNEDPILATKFSSALVGSPLFNADGADGLAEFLKARVAVGQGRPVLERIERSKYRMSRKLMDHVAAAIANQSPWILLDEQLVVFERILAAVRSGLFGRRKRPSSSTEDLELASQSSRSICLLSCSDVVTQLTTRRVPAHLPRRSGALWGAELDPRCGTLTAMLQRSSTRSTS